MKTQWLITSLFLLLSFFALLSFNKNGEILKSMAGQVQKCNALSGGNANALSHATIKTEQGNYIIAALNNCKPDSMVTVFIRRGALYFNTVYDAANHRH